MYIPCLYVKVYTVFIASHMSQILEPYEVAIVSFDIDVAETLGDALYSLQRLSDIVNDIFGQIEWPVLKKLENLPSGFASNAAPLYVLLLTNNINYSDNKY